MVMITDANRPICAKCKIKPALSLISGMWICGECLHKYIQKKEKLNREAILLG